MDRTSRIGVFVCVALLFYLWYASVPPASKVHPVTAAPVTPTPSALTATTANSTTAQSVNSTLAQTPPAPVVEQLAFLENDSIKVTFTSLGAAIKEVELKKHKEDKTGNVILNEQARSNVLQVSGWPDADAASFQVQQSPGSLVYTTTLADGVKWVRTYTLGKEYALDVKDSLGNSGAADLTLPAFGLSVGRAEPLRVAGHYQRNSNMYLGSGWLTSKFHLTTIGDFNPSSFLWVVKTREPRSAFSSKDIDEASLKWLGVENQFFTVLLTPAQDHTIQHAEFQCFNQRGVDGTIPSDAEPDIEAAAYFPELKIAAGQTVDLKYNLYAGPKEYDRLNALGTQQGELMNYDGVIPFSLLIVPMLTVLHVFHGIVGNYGVAIILLTLCIKAITWPLQSIANHSGKKMQAVAPKIKELQAKYKDQPEKLNSETFGLYREYGVNPFGGCLPALIQMPVFFSLYFMLQNAVELRGQHFLWVKDLTQSDTVAMIPFLHIGLNPLPLMVTGLTMVMMRMTPQIGDPNQAKIAQIMPLFFLFIFYNFAAALSLYYVINNCVSIIQIYRNLRKPLPELKRVPKKKT